VVEEQHTGRATMGVIFLMAAQAQFAQAQDTPATMRENSITVYGGERFGGNLTDATNGSAINLENGSSFALAVDIGLDHGTQFEVFLSRQNTALTSGAFSPKANNVGLTFNNYHIGGTAFIEEAGRGLYVMGGLGATTAKPSTSGQNSETFFSGNLGIGWMVPLARHVGLRLEARGYLILFDNNFTALCGGTAGCAVSIKGTGVIEGEVLAGLSARF
jgi:Outer membrane protein beta-barrel domain